MYIRVYLSPRYLSPGCLAATPHVIVADVIRASTTVMALLSVGAECVIPCPTVKEWLSYREQGHCLVGELNSAALKAADFGNSPQLALQSNTQGKPVAMLSTNGTQALLAAQQARAQNVWVGGFANMSLLVKHMLNLASPISIVCAGWKGAPALEDSLFAGRLIHALQPSFQPVGDSALLCWQAWKATPNNVFRLLRHNDSASRLFGLGLKQDVRLCLSEDSIQVLPKMTDKRICI